MAELVTRFPDLSQFHVVDLGGRPAFWTDVEVRPRSVTCVNLEKQTAREPWVRCVRADACDPLAIEADLVFSNSLIEHVGGHARREQLAATIHSVAPRHWVQTPYRYFPIEPHWMFPGLQFLPLAIRERVATRHWTKGTRYSREYAREAVAWTELLSITELQRLFPESQIWRERAAGLTKSIVAIRGGLANPDRVG